MNKNHSDEYLIDSLVHGNDDGIKEIYNRLYPKVRNYIVSNKGNEEDAKDLMQKSLLIISLKLRKGDFKIASTFEGYFFTVCRNLWRKEKGTSMVTIDRGLDHTSKAEEIAELIIEQEKWDLFQEKIQLLSENCRTILKLYFDKIPNAKIAKDLDYSSENVVRQRVFKCKKKLSEFIQADPRYNELKN